MNVRFIKPMESLAVKKLPTGDRWTYEGKLDGFRAVAVYRSRRSLLEAGEAPDGQFFQIALELEKLPLETVLDGDLVALDENGVQSAAELPQRIGAPAVAEIKFAE